MRRAALLALLALAGGAPAAALSQPAPEPRVLKVAAAADLRPAVADLAKAFEKANPGVRVEVTLAASGALFSQIRSGGPFDVFLSADRDFPRRIVEGKLGGPEVLYAVGRLVLWTPPGSAHAFERAGVAELAARAVERIAIANPAVAPYGRAAVAAMQGAGVKQQVQGKLVLGEDVLQAAQLAQSGAADVALIPASLAAEPALAAGKAVLVPQALHPRIEQSAVVLAHARDPRLARAFLDLVTGREGRDLLARHRYELP